jgi:hypothetical protein
VYQFGLNEGLKGLQASAAARGALGSGATQKALVKYANDYAAQNYMDYTNQRIDQSAALAQLGFGAIQGQAGMYGGLGTQLAQLGQAYNLPMAQYQVGQGQDLSAYDTAYAQNVGGVLQNQSQLQFAAAAAQAQAAAEAAAANANTAYNSQIGLSMGWR